MLFSVATRTEPSLPWLANPIVPDEDRTYLSVLSGIGWGHVFGDRNVLMAAAVGSYARDEQTHDWLPGIWNNRRKDEQRSGLLAVSHFYGIGPATLKYGAEGTTTDAEAKAFDTLFGNSAVESTLNAGRFYADVTAPVGDRLQVEAGVQAVTMDGGAIDDVNRLDPRAGIAFEPVRGHWLRAAFRRDTEFPIDFTLSPVTTLGLLPALAPLSLGGSAETTILRWDAEWGAHFFTAVEYQHQKLDQLSLAIPQTIDTLDLAEGRIDRITATANLWIGGGFGLFATGAIADSSASDATLGYNGEMPFLPETFGRAGITWVSPSRIKVTLAQTFVGERLGVRQTLAGFVSSELNAYSTTDIAFNWEPFDRRIAFDASVLNVFDRSYLVAPGAEAPGRTVLGSMKVRF
jgi:hypothetical protein